MEQTMVALPGFTSMSRDPERDAETIRELRREVVRLRNMMDHSFGGENFVVYGTASAVAELERRLAPATDERINCEVLVAPSTVITAGCKLSTVVASIRSRAHLDEPARLLNSVHPPSAS
jgi:hypothetical protein